MKLSSRGFNPRVEKYCEEEYVFDYPDKEVSGKLVKVLGWSDTCIEKIGILLEPAKPKDFKKEWENILKVFSSLGIEIKNLKERTDSVLVKMGDTVFEGCNLHFGIQLQEKKLYAIVNGRLLSHWEPVPRKDYGETVTIHQISPHTEGECLYDLQCGNETCYTCYQHRTMNGNRILCFYGNGWVEEGFPYDEERGYPGIIGKTAEKIRTYFKENRIPLFHEIYSGDIRDLVDCHEDPIDNEREV